MSQNENGGPGRYSESAATASVAQTQATAAGLSDPDHRGHHVTGTLPRGSQFNVRTPSGAFVKVTRTRPSAGERTWFTYHRNSGRFQYCGPLTLAQTVVFWALQRAAQRALAGPEGAGLSTLVCPREDEGLIWHALCAWELHRFDPAARYIHKHYGTPVPTDVLRALGEVTE